jgi:hypothetical protein
MRQMSETGIDCFQRDSCGLYFQWIGLEESKGVGCLFLGLLMIIMLAIEINKKMEPNIPGVFAAGDISGPPWQMAKAVGEDYVAGIGAATFAKKVGKPQQTEKDLL